MSGSSWTRYYAAAGNEPRETLVHALTLHDSEGRPPGLAVDLGSGTGRDTFELLRRGWRVLAVDAEPAAIAQCAPIRRRSLTQTHSRPRSAGSTTPSATVRTS